MKRCRRYTAWRIAPRDPEFHVAPSPSLSSGSPIESLRAVFVGRAATDNSTLSVLSC
jgi:hypothetical protein